ncbi:MAG: LuxR C-terminal-related transcriptional regulator, partial [Gammaproteobacteria bacterium]|nr:LuxR C-terminal-related transcriptional regulator [Gammaproteobacteria bacterium]
LVVDELDRLPASGERVIDYLIWRGPANLHLGLACRQIPRGIDVATPIAEGRGIMVGVDELGFTYREFGAFMGGAFPPERLDTLWQESHGWPIAACLQRNLAGMEADEADYLSTSWVGSRLMRGLDEDDRRFLLQAACFEWADADMFDEVLGTGATARLERLGTLRGLVSKAEGGTTFRLHPLIRRYAENERPPIGEYRDLRRDIAVALAARGRAVDAVREALAANDGDLAGRIVEDAGAIRLVCKFGLRGLQETVGLLPQDVVQSSPRLGLARLATDALDGTALSPLASATVLLGAVGDSTDDDGDEEQRIDKLVLRGLLLMCGCAPIGSDAVRSTMAQGARLVAREGSDPVVIAAVRYGQAANLYQIGDLGAARTATRRVIGLSKASPSAALAASILEGAILFAAGDVCGAEAALVSARATARKSFPGHETPELIGDVLAAEVAIETNRPSVARRRVPSLDRLSRVGAWLDVYAAAVDVRVELALREHSPTRAAAVLDEAWTFARSRGLWTLCRCVAAMRVSFQLREGRPDEANEMWLEARLPTDLEGQVDMAQQGWREMEAICCARLRLLLAWGDYAAALALGRAFAARARESGVVRVQSWASALGMHVAWSAGEAALAGEYLVEGLSVVRQAGFTRALTAHPGTTSAVLQRLESEDPGLNAARLAIVELIATSVPDGEVTFTDREMEILTRLPGQRNKEIARALGLSEDGVRYHLRNVYARLGVANRREAVRKATELGILRGAAP